MHVVGAGYVGLTTAACLAQVGHAVSCSDRDAERVELLARGEVPLSEPGLAAIVAEGLSSGRLAFGADNLAPAAESEFVVLCLPTPGGPGGRCETASLFEVAAGLAPVLRPGSVVVSKSTAPAGTAAALAAVIGRDDVEVAVNPEFLREGHSVADFLVPDRVVIGAGSPAAAARVRELLAELPGPVIVTDLVSAETAKYAANSFLAARLAVVNELAELCDAAGADLESVIAVLAHDRRVGRGFLAAGPGFGGACLPKDTEALLAWGSTSGCELGLLRSVVESNRRHLEWLVGRAVACCGGEVAGRRVALWGLAFKAGTDDARRSPAVTLATHLVGLGARLRAYDPVVHEAPDGVEVVADPYSACRDADLLVVATEWEEFAALDFVKVADVMRGRCVLDARNLLDPGSLRASGLAYSGLGRR